MNLERFEEQLLKAEGVAAFKTLAAKFDNADYPRFFEYEHALIQRIVFLCLSWEDVVEVLPWFPLPISRNLLIQRYAQSGQICILNVVSEFALLIDEKSGSWLEALRALREAAMPLLVDAIDSAKRDELVEIVNIIHDVDVPEPEHTTLCDAIAMRGSMLCEKASHTVQLANQFCCVLASSRLLEYFEADLRGAGVLDMDGELQILRDAREELNKFKSA